MGNRPFSERILHTLQSSDDRDGQKPAETWTRNFFTRRRLILTVMESRVNS